MNKKISEESLVQHPSARTNMLKIHWDNESLIKALMTEFYGSLKVLYQRLPIQRAKGESNEAYYTRVDMSIKRFIGQELGLSQSAQQYERISISKDSVLFFYLGNAESNVDDLLEWHRSLGIGLERAIGAILKLRLKISYLEDAQVHSDVRLDDSNSAFYIGAIETADKDAFSIVDSLKFDIYYSNHGEIALSVHSATFRFEKKNLSVLSTDNGSIVFHKGSKRYVDGKKISSTRYSKRPFMEFKPSQKMMDKPQSVNIGYQNCKNYHLTVCLNKIIEILDDIGIDYSPIVFKATSTLDHFLEAEPVLKNDLVIIDCFDRYPDEAFKEQFREHLKEAFGAREVLEVSQAPSAHKMKTQGVSYLVINPSGKANRSSIVNLTTGEAMNSFWQAMAQVRKGTSIDSFDYYTRIKLDRFISEIDIVCQGIDVKSVTKTVTDKNTQMKNIELLPLDKNVIKKALSELWIKESVFHQQAIFFDNAAFEPGEYQLFYARKTDDNLQYCAVVDIQAEGQSIKILSSKIWGYEGRVIFDMTYPFLKNALGKRRSTLFESFYNDGFLLYEKITGHALVSYVSGRVPKIIGNSLFDNVELHHKEGVGRKRSGKENALPYYINPAINKKMHRVFMEDNGREGVRYFVSGAKAIAGKIENQSNIYNAIVFDDSGKMIEPEGSSLANIFFNSFTYDILKNSDSAKKSILRKIVDLFVSN